MAVSSVSSLLFPSLTISSSSSFSSKQKLSSFSSLPYAESGFKLSTLKCSQSSSRVFAAPEALEAQETLDGPGSGDLEVRVLFLSPLEFRLVAEKMWKIKTGDFFFFFVGFNERL